MSITFTNVAPTCSGLAGEHDLEGVVAKWALGTYRSGTGTSWLKIKNADYSQMHGRDELFESHHAGRARKQARSVLSLV